MQLHVWSVSRGPAVPAVLQWPFTDSCPAARGGASGSMECPAKADVCALGGQRCVCMPISVRLYAHGVLGCMGVSGCGVDVRPCASCVLPVSSCTQQTTTRTPLERLVFLS